MSNSLDVISNCDVCDESLTEEEKEMNESYENYNFPICNNCIKESLEKIYYILE